MSFLTRAAILAVQDNIEREIVPCPEWGGKVLVRGLTAQERDQFEASLVDEKDGKAANLENMRAKLVALGAIDEQGARLFTVGDVASLGAKAGRPILRIAAAVQRLSGMNDKELEELSAAASVTTPAAGKNGDSLSPSDAPVANSSQASAPSSLPNSEPSTSSSPSESGAATGEPPSLPTRSSQRRGAEKPATSETT